MDYQSKIHLTSVGLNVRNISAMAEFYHQVLGFEILSIDDREAHLSIAGGGVLSLYKVQSSSATKVSGLYHTAFLLPDRTALANLFHHLLTEDLPLQGAADHGYSEAIYFKDVEGNGIEVYRDKPMAEWDFDDQGRPVGKTDPMDHEGLLALVEKEDRLYQLPQGTKIGHFHFSVPRAKEASLDYQYVYQLEDKMTIPSASWIASGNYHHHFAFNQWEIGLEVRQPGQLGLAYAGMSLKDEKDLEDIMKRAIERDFTVNRQADQIVITDTNGIAIRIK